MTESEHERGQAMTETIVAVALFALLAIALAGAAAFAARSPANSVARDALARSAEREALLAGDVLKYRGSYLAPQTVATTVPLPDGSPLPARLSLSVEPLDGGRLRVEIRADDAHARDAAAVTLDLPPPAPLPGTNVDAQRTVAQPTGAP